MQRIFVVSANIPFIAHCHTILLTGRYATTAILDGQQFQALVAAQMYTGLFCLDTDIGAAFLLEILEALITHPTAGAHLTITLIKHATTPITPQEKHLATTLKLPLFVLPTQQQAWLAYISTHDQPSPINTSCPQP